MTQAQRNKKTIPLKFILFREMNFSSSKIKKSFIFCKMEVFLASYFSYISGGDFLIS